MAINNKIQNLIRTFVKNISNDTEQAANTSTVYGTVVISDGTKQVLLDGGTEPTACIFNVEADEGDRVVCSVQNHSWSVDSNVTKPASSPTTVKGRSDVESIIDEKVISLSGIDVYYQSDEPTAPSVGFKDGDTWYELDANGYAIGLYVWKTNQWVDTQFNGGNIIRANSITGNEIASNTIKAGNIDVSNLFAQDITATGTIRGVNIVGASFEIAADVEPYSDWKVRMTVGSGLYAERANFYTCFYNRLRNHSLIIKRNRTTTPMEEFGSVNIGLYDNSTEKYSEALIKFYDPKAWNVNKTEYIKMYGVQRIAKSSTTSYMYIDGSVDIIGNNTVQLRVSRTDGEILTNAYCDFRIEPDVGILDPYSQAARDGGVCNIYTNLNHFDFNKEIFVPTLTFTGRAIHAVSDDMAINQRHSSGRGIGFGVGSGGSNRGMYDISDNLTGWIVYRKADSAAVYFGGSLFPGTSESCNIGGADHLWQYIVTNYVRFYRGTSYYYQFGGTPTANRTITFQNASGTVAFTSSDIRLKENIEDSDVCALDVINKMQIRKFDWKDVDDAGYNKGTHQNIGFIADELEKLDPRFIVDGSGGLNDDDSINPKCIDTFYLAVHLTKGIQELNDEVQKLKKALQEV